MAVALNRQAISLRQANSDEDGKVHPYGLNQVYVW
jgi:hypothetical protein